MDINNLLDIVGDLNERQEWINDLITNIYKDNPECIVVAYMCKDDEVNVVNTGYFNCDVGDKQLLATHIQIDAIDGMIKANAARYMKIFKESEDE